MNLNDFQNLLLNKQELEKALGLTIDFSESKEDYLADYAMFEYIALPDVVKIFLGENPRAKSNNKRYDIIYSAVETLVRNNQLDAKVDQEFDINGNEWKYEVYLSHNAARKYAETYNLQWGAPPYKGVTGYTETADNAALLDQLTAKEKEITQLKAEIETLQAQMQLSPTEEEEEEKQGRISKPQRNLFALLLTYLYPKGDVPNTNSVKDAINIELAKINRPSISYNTIEKLLKSE